jgi:hypothetical protein
MIRRVPSREFFEEEAKRAKSNKRGKKGAFVILVSFFAIFAPFCSFCFLFKKPPILSYTYPFSSNHLTALLRAFSTGLCGSPNSRTAFDES